MIKFSASELLQLPVPDRLQLVEDIWNSIADAPEALELTEEDKRLIAGGRFSKRAKIGCSEDLVYSQGAQDVHDQMPFCSSRFTKELLGDSSNHPVHPVFTTHPLNIQTKPQEERTG